MGKRYFSGGFVVLIGALIFLEAAGFVTGDLWKYMLGIVFVLVGIGMMFPKEQ
jgi:uncharacterized membrane protein